MKIIYTAPNRAHHYKYAVSLNKAKVLLAFVSGFSRLSPRAKLSELQNNLYRVDFLQTVYLLSLKLRVPKVFSDYLSYIAKKEQDSACVKHLNKADLFLFYNGSGLYTCKKAKKKGVITVVEVVNSHVEYQEELLRKEHEKLNLTWMPFPKLEKTRRLKEYKEADYILLPSEFVKRSFIAKGFPEEKLLKVPYGFNKSETSKIVTTQTQHSRFNILYVGSISVRKGLRYLIEAFKELEVENKKLTIVGPKANITGIEAIELIDDIVFTGVLKGDDLANAYKNADVFCLPTIEDGYGLMLGEALSYGLRIITTTNSGGDELITEGQEVYIVPICYVEALKIKLQLLGNDDKRLNKMKLAAQKKTNTLNGWKEAGGLLCKTLEELITKHK